MKFSENGQNGSNNDKFSFDGERNVLASADELPDIFDNGWDHLSPENARPLIRTEADYESDEARDWIKSADVFLLPFHNFAESNALAVKFHRKLPVANLRIRWEILYLKRKAGSAALYEADLLVIKRKIYEQGSGLKNALEINFGTDLAPLVKKYDEATSEFERLFFLNTALAADIHIKRNRKRGDEDKLGLNDLTQSFGRFKNATARLNKNAGDQQETRLRVGLTDYWLDWTEAAQRSGFDFDYLSGLKAIEMRFYELVQLLRFRDARKPMDEFRKAPLKIRYSEFSKLMPLPRLKIYDQIEDQINELCRAHLEKGYLQSTSIKPVQRKGVFADADIELLFND